MQQTPATKATIKHTTTYVRINGKFQAVFNEEGHLTLPTIRRPQPAHDPWSAKNAAASLQPIVQSAQSELDPFASTSKASQTVEQPVAKPGDKGS